ncbi:MAG: ISKra4 family transposase [Chloroflexales bacterium]|nr:ISKra4 family transposase [Chloroflexales bacterium]
MPSNAETMVPQIRSEFERLVTYVTGAERQAQTTYTVELTLFRRLLALGLALLRLFFVTRAATCPDVPTRPDGTAMTYHEQRRVTYVSVFGRLRFARHYVVARGQPGACPLDAVLSLPACIFADLVRDWTAHGCTDGAYRESQTVLERILGLTLRVQTLEQHVARDAVDVDAFYAHPPAPDQPVAAGSILVVQADSKGTPLIQPSSAPPARRQAGQLCTRNKEAVVTCLLYTMAPSVRSPQEVVAALLNAERPRPRPRPMAKEQHATLDGKNVAFTRLVQRAAHREGYPIQHRVALTDGAAALQPQMQTHFPHHTLILDSIYASAYLWESADALLGDQPTQQCAWMRTRLELLLTGQTERVITALETAAPAPERTSAQQQALVRTSAYDRRNQPYMRYQDYLAQGWPKGTGVVEGACGHLVKDRMEQAGMRWTKAGAQPILDLRAVRLNGDWDAYGQFHRQQQHQRLYGTGTATVVEDHLLALAA